MGEHRQRASEIPERREVTVVFCDLGGYTEWNEEAEPEDVAAMMDRIKQYAVQTFESHGGVANQFIGDEVLGLFGIASSHDDDPCRAVLATLALHAFVRGQELFRANGQRRLLRMHSGVETGLVFARPGDPRSGLWEVTGDTLNTAARLRSLAGSDEILVGAHTKRALEPYFETETLPPVKVRGKLVPLEPHRISRMLRTPFRFDAARSRGLTRYVGRHEQLACLHHALHQARAGSGSVVAVVGPPGIGKTRLLYEFRRELGKNRQVAPYVVHGRCFGYGEVAPYAPFVDALLGGASGLEHAGRRALQRIRRLRLVSEPAQNALTHLLAPPETQRSIGERLEGASLREAIVAALLELVANAARRRGLVLLLEDWQWADEASRALLQQLASAVSSQRVLVVVNHRPLPASAAFPAATQQIELEPLDKESTEAVARATLGADRLPAGLVQFIHERAQGNPFFVEEVCRSLLDTGALERRAGWLALHAPLTSLRAPASVHAIVRARLDGLTVRAKHLLRVAAVMGGDFAGPLLARLCGEPEDDAEDLLRGLEAQGFVYRTDPGQPSGYRFKHAITREVTYESVPLDERRWLHGQVARSVEQLHAEELQPAYELLAHHYGRSGERDKALEYATRAGDKAWRAFSLESAASHYRRALEHLEELRLDDAANASRRVDLSVRWARVGLYNPHADQVRALRLAEQQARRFGDERGACLCLNWMSWIEYALGHQRQAAEVSEEFRGAADRLRDSALVAQALTNLGLSHAMAAEHEQGRALIQQGIETRGRFTGTSYAYALGYLAMIAGDRGEFARAYEDLALATRIIEDEARPTLLGPLLVQRSMVESWQGAWERSQASGQKAQQVAERIGGHYIHAMGLTFEGVASFMLRRDAAAIDKVREAYALLQERRIRLHESLTVSALADMLVVSGAYAEAHAFAQQALACAAQGDRLGEVTALRVLATHAALSQRDLTLAASFVTRALACARARGSPREEALTRLCWAELLLAHARAEPAEAELGAALPVLTSFEMRWHQAAAERLRRETRSAAHPELP